MLVASCGKKKCRNTGASTHVLPGTIIVTDAWAGYANLNQINNSVYQHYVVVHAHHFVDPVHGEVNTQTIEDVWMQAKRKLRYQSGTSRTLFASYLCAFLWRFCHKRHVFGQYLKLLSDVQYMTEVNQLIGNCFSIGLGDVC